MNINRAIEIAKKQINNAGSPASVVRHHHLIEVLQALAEPETIKSLKKDFPFSQDISIPSPFGYCRFCKGSGFEKKDNIIYVYGRDLKNISEIIEYAYQHGYEDK